MILGINSAGEPCIVAGGGRERRVRKWKCEGTEIDDLLGHCNRPHGKLVMNFAIKG